MQGPCSIFCCLDFFGMFLWSAKKGQCSIFLFRKFVGRVLGVGKALLHFRLQQS